MLILTNMEENVPSLLVNAVVRIYLEGLKTSTKYFNISERDSNADHSN
jgi:hypothetical protein